MIAWKEGDIFTSDCECIVIPVNTKSVMGDGLALEFKNKYPEGFRTYQACCKSQILDVGKSIFSKHGEKWFMFFATKREWQNPSKIEYVEEGLKEFSEKHQQMPIKSFAFPLLGAGRGKLRIQDVKNLLVKYLDNLPVTIEVWIL